MRLHCKLGILFLKIMKTTLTMLLLLICMTVQAQVRLNYSVEEIKSDDELSMFAWTTDYTDAGYMYLSGVSDKDHIQVLYYFYKEKCYMTCIVPLNVGALQGIVERYNSKYVIKSSKSWMYYSTNGILQCSLEQLDNGTYYFQWTNYQN